MQIPILAFAAGILWLQTRAELPDPRLWGAAAVLLFGCGVLCRRAGRSGVLLIGLACLACGVAFAGWRAGMRLDDALPTAWEGQDVRISGVIAELPQDFERGQRFVFAVEAVLTADARVPARILLSWYDASADGAAATAREHVPGERWALTVRLRRPHGNANPGGFDYEAWLLERDLRAIGYVRPGGAERLPAAGLSPLVWIERWRHDIRQNFARVLPPGDYPWAGILVALAIGDQKAIHGESRTIFNRTSTTHLMSISGLHVTLFATLVGGLAGWGWRRVPALARRWPAQQAALLTGSGAALVYALLSGFAVPAQRTLYMLLVAALAMLSGRIVASGRILALALLVVLLLDPWAVLAPGFWLSFGAVAALLYVGAAQVGTLQGWRDRLRQWGLTQWAATLSSLPVLLLLFQQLSLVSPLANAVAIPVVSFIVTPLALLAALWPAWPLLVLAHGVLAGLMVFLEACAAWPVWLVPAPPLAVAALAGLGVAVLLLPRGVPGRGLGFALVLPALFWPAERPPPGAARVTVLDVGQGLASVVSTAHHTLIYDPGPLYSAESDAGQRVVAPYLRQLGIDAVDMLIITHRDSDHSGGAASVRSAVAVGEVRSSLGDPGSVPCLAGQRWHWDGVDFSLLHPERPATAVDRRSNHFSCVLRIEAAGRRMLLTSDIEREDEAALLARAPEQLAADVLLVPHHGSKTSSTAEFLRAAGAAEAIIPVGYRNRFGHPRADVLARHEAQGSRIWRTDRDGALTVDLGSPGVEVAAWRQSRPRYWYGR